MKPSSCSAVDCETTPIDRPAPTHFEAEHRLRRSRYRALQHVRCLATDEPVCLDGCLPSFSLEQVAPAIAAGMAGVRRASNRIEVHGPASPTRPRPVVLPQEAA